MNRHSSRARSAAVVLTVAAAVVASLTLHFAGPDAAPTRVHAQPVGNDDYLSPELRRKVQQLKRDVGREPTNAANGPDRALILFDWANAFSLRGGVIPVNLTSIIGSIAGHRRSGRAAFRLFDQYVTELQLREEQPTAIGTLTSDNPGPFTPEQYVTISQTYQFGDMPMVPGGGFFVARHFMSNHGVFQTNQPDGDNYISIASSNSDARFVPDSRPMNGMHGGFRGAAPGLFFRLREGTLTKRDTVTITYGDRSGGSRGLRMQTYSNDAFPLPLYVDLRGNRQLMTLPIQTYRVMGGPASGVRGFAPSIVKTGERFTVSVRSEDRYRNRASGAIPEYEVEVNGNALRTISAGEQAITLIDDVVFEQPGVYRVSIQSADGTITGQCNPIWVQEDPNLRVYWGDTHGHCGFAEGQGTPQGFWEFGRDDARLDFLTHSEHDTWLDDREWQTLIDNVNEYNDDGNFVAILGYEWTVQSRLGGHHNVFFRTATERKRVPNQTAPVLSQLYRRLGNENDMEDVLIIPHAHQTGEYRLSDPDMETLVEIMSMHGNFEWFGIMYLNHGHEVGFVAASDDHLSHPGYSTPLRQGLAQPGGLAAVLAPEKSRDAIFDALKDLASYATTGHRILVDFTVNGSRMGTRAAYAAKRQIRGRVIGTAPIDEVSLVKNGEVIQREGLLTVSAANAGPRQTVEVQFASTSDPVIRDIPRGWRPWVGRLQVHGAQLVDVQSPSISNPLTEYIRRSEENPNRVEFSLLTRGSMKNLVLVLDAVAGDASVEVTLDETREGPSPPPMFRSPARIPGDHFTLRIDEPGAGQRRNIQGLEESVLLRRIRSDGPLEHTFEFVDEQSPRQGDYYYLRVRQLDGGMAWSSPIWVGGFPVR